MAVSDLDLVWLRDPGYLLRDNPEAGKSSLACPHMMRRSCRLRLLPAPAMCNCLPRLLASPPSCGADMILSEDGGQDNNARGDAGLSVTGSVWVNFNTGAYLLRANQAVAAFVRAWREFQDTCPVYYKHRNDQASRWACLLVWRRLS